MATYKPNEVNDRYFFQLFSGALIPRPIAWITTRNDDESINVAPYSFFSGINTRPPMVMVSIGTHENELKHTSANLQRTKECVIHIPSLEHIDAVNKTAHKFEPLVSEAHKANLTLISSSVVQTPSIEGAHVRIECTVNQMIQLSTNQMFLMDVQALYIDDSVMTNGIPDVRKLNPLSRVGGNFYTTVGDVIQKVHPDKEEPS
jgi:flavin reductase (DIM6/NTAB) family NADH-FMN oxidoreductase RutF